MFPQDNNSLLGAIQGYYQMLEQQRLAEQGMGINPQIQQAQDANNLLLLQAAQKAGQMQPQAPVQPVTYDPNNSQANLAKSLIAAGPGDFIPSTVGPRFAGGVAATPGATQAGTRDWMRAIDNANFWDKSSFYGGGLRQMSPEEYAKAQLSAETAGPMAAQGLLSQIQKQQGVSPEALKAIIGPAADVTKAGLISDAQTKAAQLDKEGKIGAAEVAGKYGLAAEQVKTGATNNQLTKNTRASLEQVVTDNKALQGNLHNLGASFDPSFFTVWGKTKTAAADLADKLGVAPQAAQDRLRRYTVFQQQTEQMFNQYRKAITGAAASDAELVRLKKSIFNTEMGPTGGATALLDLMGEMQIKTALAQKFLNEGLVNNVSIEPGKKLQSLVDGAYENQITADQKNQIKETLKQMYPALGANSSATGATVNGTNVNNYSAEDIAAALARKRGQK